MNYTIGPPGLDNLDFQWFSNLHCKSGVLPVISERMEEQMRQERENGLGQMEASGQRSNGFQIGHLIHLIGTV